MDIMCRLQDCKSFIKRQTLPQIMKLKIEEHQKCVQSGQCPRQRSSAFDIKCVNGKAGQYDCKKVDLLSFTPIAKLGSSKR